MARVNLSVLVEVVPDPLLVGLDLEGLQGLLMLSEDLFRVLEGVDAQSLQCLVLLVDLALLPYD